MKATAQLIECGFHPAHLFKRSTWTKVERIMEFLANKGEVVRLSGPIKYGTRNGVVHTDEVIRLAKVYLKSPFVEHIDQMRAMSKELGLPLNSIELLKAFTNR